MPTAFKLFAMPLLAKAIRATTVNSRDLPAGYDFNPRELFSANEQGIWLDPSDFSTMYQDSAGTTPVTAVGQPVGKILDKSGRGNHPVQATAASRPTLQQDSNGLYYLSFDGTDDGMLTPSINFTGTDKMTVWAGVRKLSDAASATIVELSSDASAIDGTFLLRGPTGAADNYALYARGTAGALAGPTPSPFTAPTTNVLVMSIDTSLAVANKIYGRVNGTTYTNAVDMGTGNFGNYPLYIGRRNNAERPFNGRIYQLIVRGAASNDGQIAATEAYVNAKTRAY